MLAMVLPTSRKLPRIEQFIVAYNENVATRDYVFTATDVFMFATCGIEVPAIVADAVDLYELCQELCAIADGHTVNGPASDAQVMWAIETCADILLAVC